MDKNKILEYYKNKITKSDYKVLSYLLENYIDRLNDFTTVNGKQLSTILGISQTTVLHGLGDLRIERILLRSPEPGKALYRWNPEFIKYFK
jgi:hypothetical protein